MFLVSFWVVGHLRLPFFLFIALFPSSHVPVSSSFFLLHLRIYILIFSPSHYLLCSFFIISFSHHFIWFYLFCLFLIVPNCRLRLHLVFTFHYFPPFFIVKFYFHFFFMFLFSHLILHPVAQEHPRQTKHSKARAGNGTRESKLKKMKTLLRFANA